MLINPNELHCPDYTLPAYSLARQPFLSDTCTEAQATEILAKVWHANIQVEKVFWQQKVEAEAARAAEELREQAEREEVMFEAAEQEKLEAQKEDRKKNRSKYIDIPDRPPPSRPTFVPTSYARQKIKQGLYVELCYFTN